MCVSTLLIGTHNQLIQRAFVTCNPATQVPIQRAPKFSYKERPSPQTKSFLLHVYSIAHRNQSVLTSLVSPLYPRNPPQNVIYRNSFVHISFYSGNIYYCRNVITFSEIYETFTNKTNQSIRCVANNFSMVSNASRAKSSEFLVPSRTIVVESGPMNTSSWRFSNRRK